MKRKDSEDMKKQIAAILTATVFALGVTACGAAADEGQEPRGTSQEEAQESSQETSQDEASQTQDAQTDTEDQDGGSSNILIAYFSVPEDVDTEGIDADAGASIVVKDGQVMGNLEYMADVIQQSTGGDIFRIETVDQYPLDHDTLVDQAAQEQDDEARPQLAGQIEATDQYDTILLGYLVGRSCVAGGQLCGEQRLHRKDSDSLRDLRFLRTWRQRTTAGRYGRDRRLAGRHEVPVGC